MQVIGSCIGPLPFQLAIKEALHFPKVMWRCSAFYWEPFDTEAT
jgi:hypothetical protein